MTCFMSYSKLLQGGYMAYLYQEGNSVDFAVQTNSAYKNKNKSTIQ